MGWQDRDYAREQPPVSPHEAAPPPRGRGLLAQYGIVNLLIIINILIHVLKVLAPKVYIYIYAYGVLWPRGVTEAWQIWRLFTSQYIHHNMFHIGVNMLGLYFLGRPLEERWSAKKFFTIYTLCGLAGNVFYMFLANSGEIPQDTPAYGASGCIYGLLGIVAVMFPHAVVFVYFLFPIRIRTAAFVFGSLAFLRVLTKGQNYGGEACHLAGLAFGVWWAAAGDQWWRNSEWRLPWKR